MLDYGRSCLFCIVCFFHVFLFYFTESQWEKPADLPGEPSSFVPPEVSQIICSFWFHMKTFFLFVFFYVCDMFLEIFQFCLDASCQSRRLHVLLQPRNWRQTDFIKLFYRESDHKNEDLFLFFFIMSESSWEKPADFSSGDPSGAIKTEVSKEEHLAPQPEPLSGGAESSNGANQEEARVPEEASQQSTVPKISFRVR